MEMIDILIKELCKAGKRHTEAGLDNQDVVMSAENDRYTVIALADGVSTCKESKKGAYTACGAIINLMCMI